MEQSPQDIAHDLENIQGALNGDQGAFRGIVEKYHAYIFKLCWRMTQNRQDAADLTQETFLKLYTHLKDYKPGQKLSNWLYTIALNDCRKHLRRKKIVRFFSYSADDNPGELTSESLMADKGIQQAQSQDLLNRLVASLPESYRSVFILRYFDGLGEEEIAQVTGLTISNVRVRIHRARRYLWEKHGDLIQEFL